MIFEVYKHYYIKKLLYYTLEHLGTWLIHFELSAKSGGIATRLTLEVLSIQMNIIIY